MVLHVQLSFFFIVFLSFLSTVNSNLDKISDCIYVHANSKIGISFKDYSTTALIFMARSDAHAMLYVYSNGYLVPIKTDDMVIVSLSSDYKTITVENNSTGTAYLGVLQGGNADFELYGY